MKKNNLFEKLLWKYIVRFYKNHYIYNKHRRIYPFTYLYSTLPRILDRLLLSIYCGLQAGFNTLNLRLIDAVYRYVLKQYRCRWTDPRRHTLKDASSWVASISLEGGGCVLSAMKVETYKKIRTGVTQLSTWTKRRGIGTDAWVWLHYWVVIWVAG